MRRCEAVDLAPRLPERDTGINVAVEGFRQCDRLEVRLQGLQTAQGLREEGLKGEHRSHGLRGPTHGRASSSPVGIRSSSCLKRSIPASRSRTPPGVARALRLRVGPNPPLLCPAQIGPIPRLTDAGSDSGRWQIPQRAAWTIARRVGAGSVPCVAMRNVSRTAVAVSGLVCTSVANKDTSGLVSWSWPARIACRASAPSTAASVSTASA